MPKLIQIVTLGLQGSVKRNSLYESLSEENEEIRLLNVLPSENDSVVECTVFTTSLRSQPTFTALSYVWGDLSLDDKIIVNNQAVYVTVSLASALRHIRNKNSPEIVTIWVDALSINQENKHEKSHQVQFMRQIYRRASLVIGFLGESADDSPYAIDLLHRIAYEISVEQNTCLAGPGEECAGPSEGHESWLERIPELCDYHVEDDDYRIWEAVSKLLKRPYWIRVWIRQEIALAQNLQFLVGNDSITWDILVRALEPFGVFRGADSISKTPLARQWEILDSSEHGHFRLIEITRRYTRTSMHSSRSMPLSLAIISAIGAEASNPLDCIYGVLGLADSEIIVDYESTSAEDLYTDFSRKAVEDPVGEICLPLYHAGVGSRRQFPSLPSWVIDLSTCGKSGYSWNRDYKACGDTLISMAEPTIHDNKLQIKVGFIDSIVKTVQFEQMKGLSELASAAIELFELGDKPFEFLWRFFWTLMVGTLDELKVALQAESPHYQDLYDLFLYLLGHGLEQTYFHGSEVKSLGLIAEILARSIKYSLTCLDDTENTERLVTLLSSRIARPFSNTGAIFRTERGYIGLGTPATQRKDNVCIIPGHTLPLLLRNSGQSFQLVSTCYIPDLMNGEAVGNDAEAWAASLPKIEII